jgi:hypothetical protein
LDVVRLQIAAARIAASLTHETISLKYIKAPTFIGCSKSLTSSFLQAPVLVGMALGPCRGLDRRR